MSVSENKEILRRQSDEMWVQQNVDKVDEFISEDFKMGPYEGRDSIRKALTEMFSDTSGPHVVRVEYHEIVGEGDVVAARQTNHMSDGSTVEGATFAVFKNGKIVANHWYTIQQE